MVLDMKANPKVVETAAGQKKPSFSSGRKLKLQHHYKGS
jgi:hypothetical protein